MCGSGDGSKSPRAESHVSTSSLRLSREKSTPLPARFGGAALAGSISRRFTWLGSVYCGQGRESRSGQLLTGSIGGVEEFVSSEHCV